MGLHTVVFIGSAGADFAALNGASDGVFGLLEGALIPPQSTHLVAVVAGGATVESARLEQRSMDITPANLRPINIFPWPSPTGAMCTPNHAPMLPGGEGVQASAQGSGTGVVVAWCSDRIEAVPQGQSFLLSFECDVTLATKAWSRAELSWQVPYLPVGRYQIVGMEVYSRNASPSDVVAARLLLPNQVHRPGALVFTGATAEEASQKLPPPFQMDGSLGCWGWFEQGSPPSVEAIGLTPGTATLRGTLRVIKETGVGSVRGGGVAWG